MSGNNQTNPDKEDIITNEEDTEISLPPPAPNFEMAEAAPVQPVIPVASVPGEVLGTLPQQPQVVYVAQPTVVQPTRSWSWIPAALVLLLVATVAGAFVGAELYKRSTYAEPATPYSSDVSPYADENKSLKSGEQNSFSDKKEADLSGSIKTGDDKSEPRPINSISTGFAPIQKTEIGESEQNSENIANNEVGENIQENSEDTDEEINAAKNETKAEQRDRQLPTEDEEPPPPPARRKTGDFQPKKVENIKDTENVVPPQRNLPD